MIPKSLRIVLLLLPASLLPASCASNTAPAVPASDAVASSDGRISTEYFTESGISTLDSWLSRPLDAEAQCYPVDDYFDLYACLV